MAETLLPSVRGRSKLVVATLALTASTATGALTGFAAAVAAVPLRWFAIWCPLTSPVTAWDTRSVVVGLVLAGATLDAVALARRGRARPPAYGRQVPREWGRWLAPEVVAVLYGARLGIGPSTVLSTWTWWSVTVAGALLGFGPAVAAGAVFGAVRILVTIAVSARLSRRRTGIGSGRITRPRTGWAAVDGLVVAAVAALALTACASAPRPVLAAPDPPPPAPTDLGAQGATGGASRTENGTPTDLGAQGATGGASRTENGPSGRSNSAAHPSVPAATPITRPATVEDFVPSSQQIIDPVTAAREASARPAPVATPAALGAALVRSLTGFDPVADPAADRFLDLGAAAAVQPDPPSETALLQTRGFQGGWTRAFRSEANDVVVASVYQFTDPGQAEFYLEDGLILIGGYGGRFFDLPALPGVRGFHQEITDGDETLVTLGGAWHEGPRWYLVYLVGQPATVTPDALVGVLQAQHAVA